MLTLVFGALAVAGHGEEHGNEPHATSTGEIATVHQTQ
jgi:hypothetical protein